MDMGSDDCHYRDNDPGKLGGIRRHGHYGGRDTPAVLLRSESSRGGAHVRKGRERDG